MTGTTPRGSACEALEQVPLWADPERIGQVLTNLLGNALRHTPSSGTVIINCRAMDHQAEYAVADSGDGLAAEHLPHVFDPFYPANTTRDRARSTFTVRLPARPPSSS